MGSRSRDSEPLTQGSWVRHCGASLTIRVARMNGRAALHGRRGRWVGEPITWGHHLRQRHITPVGTEDRRVVTTGSAASNDATGTGGLAQGMTIAPTRLWRRESRVALAELRHGTRRCPGVRNRRIDRTRHERCSRRGAATGNGRRPRLHASAADNAVASDGNANIAVDSRPLVDYETSRLVARRLSRGGRPA